MTNMKYFPLSIILILATLQANRAIEFTITNTVESPRFTNEIGISYTKRILNSSTCFIWKTFHQNSLSDRVINQKIDIFIDNFTFFPAYTQQNQIHFSALDIEKFSGDVRQDFTGILYHMMTRIWQWNGNGLANSGLISGISDFVRLKAGYAPSNWVKPGQGESWDHGFDITALFLDYCNSLKNGFVAELNEKMKNGYSVEFFEEIVGKTVDQLWSEYKAKYAN